MTPRELLSLPAEVALAEGFARTLVELAEASGTTDPAALANLRSAARAASLATADGHSCVRPGDLPGSGEAGIAAWRESLLASGMVATADAAQRPLVLDAGDRLYLWRYYAVERRLAARLLEFGELPLSPEAAEQTERRLAERFGAADPARPDHQRQAVALAMRRRLTVISGGPGTGKTTIVGHILALRLELDPNCRILLAAPTGKAAARLRDAVQTGGATLPAELRARLPSDGFTVHRLLARAAADGTQLPCDLLVVDEASMLDLMLADRLLDVIGPRTQLILLGDRHQLAAVEAGAVFGEICSRDAVEAAPSPLAGSIVELRHSYRFGSDTALGRLAAAARNGDAPALFAGFDGGETTLATSAERQPDAAMAEALLAGYAEYIDAIASGERDPQPLFAALGRYRVLCALREGPRGVAGLNELLARRLHRRDDDSGGGAWYAGRPVLVTRNDPLLRLFNGDVGIALPTAGGGFRVWFEAAEGFRAVAPARLPAHETALAMTVHKAQGSEFERVALVLPATRSPVATRELVYTGITRARKTVAIFAPTDVLASALTTPTDRHSGLAARLREGHRPPLGPIPERQTG